MPKTALITGITGQDGSYLVELLLAKGYNVHGLVRRTSQFNRARIDESREQAAQKGQVFDLHYGDLADASSISRIIAKVKPDELYNLAGQSHVGVSFEEPEYTALVDALGVLRLLESIKHISPATRFYQASSSELFGNTGGNPANENTPFRPRSPYAAAKQYAYWTVVNYRESYGLHASNGILFNHESPRRGESFVTRKITLGFARIRAGLDQTLRLGNMESRRDWGYAKEYVELMWRILQQDHADDYVIATGESHTVREFVEQAAKAAGFDIRWEGSGEHEVGRDVKSGRILVQIDPRYYRPSEIDATVGDPGKARAKLGWNPRVKFQDLVTLMVKADLERLGSFARNMTETGQPIALPPRPSLSAIPRIKLFDIPFFRVTESELVNMVIAESGASRGGWIITPNLDILRQGVQKPEIRALLSRADVLVADGMPLIWASRLQKTPLPERVSGSHIIWTIPEAAAKAGRSIFLLGGAPRAADECARVLERRFPALRITGTCCPQFGFERSEDQIAALRAAVASHPADIIFVALSFPKGEHLIEKIRDVAPNSWWIGVGISFSFVAGDVKKAPRWMQVSGLEWLHRLTQEPGRLARRYLIDGIPFAARLLIGSFFKRFSVKPVSPEPRS